MAEFEKIALSGAPAVCVRISSIMFAIVSFQNELLFVQDFDLMLLGKSSNFMTGQADGQKAGAHQSGSCCERAAIGLKYPVRILVNSCSNNAGRDQAGVRQSVSEFESCTARKAGLSLSLNSVSGCASCGPFGQLE